MATTWADYLNQTRSAQGQLPRYPTNDFPWIPGLGQMPPGPPGPGTTTAPNGPPASPQAPGTYQPFSLAQLFSDLFPPGTVFPTGMGTTPFGGTIPADQQATAAISWRDFLQNLAQYRQDFGESQRRYNQDFSFQSEQDKRNFGENVRQFQSQFDEQKRRYEIELPWLRKRDAWSIAGAALLPNARFLTR
jgi:hypothetical protein